MKKNSSELLLRLSANWPEVEVLSLDADILALSKPAGLLIAPDRWDKTRENLMGLLHAGIALQRPWAVKLGLSYVANVHRLDAGTSGVVLMALNKPALVKLARQFHDQHPKKTYLALIQGALPEPETEVNLPLAPSLVHPGLSVVDRSHGKSAVTRFSTVEKYRKYSLIRAEPTTGRLHQIRVHLKEIGCPLVADADYGTGFPLLLSQLKRDYRMKPEGEKPFMARPALHAEKLELIHPTTGLPLVIEAPWPKDFTVSVKYLRKFAG
jgi:RluA family pseudouridine synthase